MVEAEHTKRLQEASKTRRKRRQYGIVVGVTAASFVAGLGVSKFAPDLIPFDTNPDITGIIIEVPEHTSSSYPSPHASTPKESPKKNSKKTTRPTAIPTITQPEGETQEIQGQLTFYGSYDNDPKGSTVISDPVIHKEAGGTGSYEDPLTFASPEGEGAYKKGQIIYVPALQKYYIKEDKCAVSWTAPDGCGEVTHVDLYIGNPSATKDVTECEDTLTPDDKVKVTIILNPPKDLPYDKKPLWDEQTKTCYKPPELAKILDQTQN